MLLRVQKRMAHPENCFQHSLHLAQSSRIAHCAAASMWHLPEAHMLPLLKGSFSHLGVASAFQVVGQSSWACCSSLNSEKKTVRLSRTFAWRVMVGLGYRLLDWEVVSLLGHERSQCKLPERKTILKLPGSWSSSLCLPRPQKSSNTPSVASYLPMIKHNIQSVCK